MKLAGLFDLIEKNKNKLAIEEYSISQTTLDEVRYNVMKFYQVIINNIL